MPKIGTDNTPLALIMTWTGKFILLSLFLAVILEHFENEYRKEERRKLHVPGGGILARLRSAGEISPV